MTERRSKKSESIEVRLPHEVKQAFMSKAAVEGRTASEIIRRSITTYLRDGSEGVQRSPWKHAVALAVPALALLFAYSISTPATADHQREFEAARARLAFDRAGPAERRMLKNEFGKEFAAQRLWISQPDRPGAKHGAFTALDLDSDDRLSFVEYRQLSTVPDGEPGRKLFRSYDANQDDWIAEEEFQL